MFWNNFINLCAAAGKSPTRVIEELKIARSAVTKWKNGAIPSKTSLKKLGEYFDVDPQSLFAAPLAEPAQGESMFYLNFTKLCRERGTTPTAVCKDIGISTASGTNWKNGSIPSKTTLKKLGEYFDVDSQSLFAAPEELPPARKRLEEATEGFSDRDLDELIAYASLIRARNK